MATAQTCTMEQNSEMSVEDAYSYLHAYFPTHAITGKIPKLYTLRPYDIAQAYRNRIKGNKRNDEIRTTAYQAAQALLKYHEYNHTGILEILDPKPITKEFLSEPTTPVRKPITFNYNKMYLAIATGCVTVGGITAYIFRNQLSSLFDARIKPVFKPVFNYVSSKTPNCFKAFWSK